MAVGSVVAGLYALYSYYIIKRTVVGWTTTVLLVSLMFSVQLLMTGVLGEYVGRVYEQVKGRPLYVVGERIGFKRKKLTSGSGGTSPPSARG
jgi:dolichol-phosphate mannosyltransferase